MPNLCHDEGLGAASETDRMKKGHQVERKRRQKQGDAGMEVRKTPSSSTELSFCLTSFTQSVCEHHGFPEMPQHVHTHNIHSPR